MLLLDSFKEKQNSSAFYNIVQQEDGLWRAEIILSFDDDKRGFALPLNIKYDNPFRIFQVIQMMGIVYSNLSPNVYIVDNQKRLRVVLKLTETLTAQVATEEESSTDFAADMPVPTHEGPLTLN